MNIKLRFSSVPLILNYLKKIKNGTEANDSVQSIFEHPDYEFEIKRYGVTSKESIIDYFENIGTIREEDIPELCPNRPFALRNKHKMWKSAYENPDHYIDLLEKLKAYFTEETLKQVYLTVKEGFPSGVEIDDTEVVITMSIGPSFGYVFDNAFHIDLMGIDVYCELNKLAYLIAHEVHHLVFLRYISEFENDFTLEDKFILHFAAEGLAIKFCNNAKGVISKPLRSEADDYDGLDKFSIEYLNERFSEIFSVFVDTVKGIRNGRLTEKDIAEQNGNYWWNPYLEGQDRSESPKLLQCRIYSLGNDIFGTIYDAFGIDEVYECARKPSKTLECFYRACKTVGFDIDNVCGQ